MRCAFLCTALFAISSAIIFGPRHLHAFEEPEYSPVNPQDLG
jgi:hypothetical protein